MPANTQESVRNAVLLVDDDSIALRLASITLKRRGYSTVSASNVEQARQKITELGPSSFNCVITDYQMDGETGLDLISWLKTADPTLAPLLMTAKGDKDLIRQSLREGALDFLEKPVLPDDLVSAVQKAVEATQERRRLATTQLAATQMTGVQSHILRISPLFQHKNLRFVFQSKHEAGGDFVQLFPMNDGGALVVMADISGHDLKAAYISAYFQGMIRGLLFSGVHPREVVSYFNQFLVNEWNRASLDEPGGGSKSSLAVAVLMVDPADHHLTLQNAGMPLPRLSDSRGRVEPLGAGSCPLGWFDELELDEVDMIYPENGSVYLWTDGLEDQAGDLNVDPFALAYRLTHLAPEETIKSVVGEALDDLMILRIDLDLDRTQSRDGFQPILSNRYHGAQISEIDALQSRWERSLAFTGIPIDPEKSFDILLCAREAVLNALAHGCEGRPDLECEMQLAYHPGQRCFRLVVSDPGPGHSNPFLLLPEDQEPEDDERHHGFVILKRLSQRVLVENNGARLTLEFDAPALVPADEPAGNLALTN